MFSQTAEYALRAAVHLASIEQGPAHAVQTVTQIAEVTRVPAGYLAKVLQNLSRAGVITSQRGLGGGFRLAKAARDTSIYEVIQAVAPIARIRTCPLGLEAHGANLCPLHKRLDDAMAAIEEQFRTTNLEELATSPKPPTSSLVELCSFPLQTS